MKPRELMRRFRSGSLANVSFSEFVAVVEAFGFERIRVTGSHQTFRHPMHGIELNLQPKRGQAKPYQIRQFLQLVESRNISWEN
jgi:predicted RNA binding protein YcfA (HicA-like mRNA interferase family)